MDKLDFDTLANGALKERFTDALDELLDNIADPNTEPKKARKLTLTLILTPNEQRDFAAVSFEVKTAPVPPKAIGTSIIIDRDLKGKVVAAETIKKIPGQMAIQDIVPDNSNVVSMQQKSN